MVFGGEGLAEAVDHRILLGGGDRDQPFDQMIAGRQLLDQLRAGAAAERQRFEDQGDADRHIVEQRDGGIGDIAIAFAAQDGSFAGHGFGDAGLADGHGL